MDSETRSHDEQCPTCGRALSLSVVIPTFNRADRLQRTIDAWSGQEEAGHFEVVVVDDGSTDDTPAVLERLASSRTRWIRQTNQGLAASRNTGARTATGQYLVFSDDDDVPSPQFISELRKTLRSRCVRFITCAARYVDADGRVLTIDTPLIDVPLFKGFSGASRMPICVDRDLYRQVGGFDPEITGMEFTEFMLRLAPALDLATETAILWTPLIDIETRPTDARPSRRPDLVRAGVEGVIARHSSTLLEREPRALSNYHAIAGVAAFRMGDRRAGRSHMSAAFSIRPTLKGFSRLILAWTPGGWRFWASSD